ncbi:MAG: histidine kinase [Prolixibacteraceae bacterium]|nr:histidine kinase [Prolixibacteraceae bacterium]
MTKKPIGLFKFILANAILSFLIIAVFMNGFFNDWKIFGIGYLWAFSISITQWGGIQWLHGLVDRHISWIEAPARKTVVQIVVFLIYSTTAFILVQFLNFYVWRGITPGQSWESIVKSIPYTLLVSFLISLIFTVIGFFQAWRRSFIQAEKLKVEMMAYKYESLRNQINPHFLFNSLNVLSDLVYDDQKLAVKFIRQLSDLFRYVLDSRDKELVPLGEELDFMQSFTFLLKTRFEDKLQITVDVEPSADDYIVPMTLQLLVENAVKHNEVSEAFPLKIEIRKTGDFLEVKNNLQPKSAGDDSKKTGLKNITQQFAFFSDQPIKIISTDEFYAVRVPILKALQR